MIVEALIILARRARRRPHLRFAAFFLRAKAQADNLSFR
jgi:hypothetical protein